jgi:hypothetical protein
MDRLSESDTLWAQLRSMDLDRVNVNLPYSRRLARDNAWTLDYATRVVFEYKRFLYLAATVAHPVTPSDEVDQAWHLHLLYSQHYWDVLCADILRRPLHHGPTRGGAEEGRKYLDWYTRTLEAYERAFAEQPPSDIWPSPRTRFSDVSAYRRINTHRHLILPRFRLRSMGVVVLSLFLAGCVASLVGREWLFIPLVLLLAIVGVALMWPATKRKGHEDTDDRGSGCGASGCGGCGD